MNWPTIPGSLSGLTATQLRSLATQIRDARKANVSTLSTLEEKAEYDGYVELQGRITALADETEAEEAAEAQAAADAAAAQAAAETPEPVVESETVASVTVSTSMAIETTSREVVPPSQEGIDWLSTGIGGGVENQRFASMRDLALAIQGRAGQVSAGSDIKHVVAKMPGNFAAHQVLDANPFLNLGRFDSAEEITAAMCAPLTPLYNLSCQNETRRPVQMGLPAFSLPANRGGFSVYPSPTLSDITGGYGQWTSAHDANVNAIKAACQTISCSTSTEYEIYGVYRCLTVKNLVNMTFPEIVEAYLNRLQAAHARYAEVLLLEAMGNDSTQVDTIAGGYNATTTITSMILNYLALYQEQERWDVPMMDAWMPRWLLWAIKTDVIRRRRTDGGFMSVPSDEAVAQMFRDVGVEPHWYMDRPSWATPIPQLATAGVLNFFPRHLEILLHRRGKYAYMDRGELQVGVTGNNIYRLNDDLRKNQFTFFYESFEGIINTDSCPSHILQVPNLCYNGVQIDDIVITCEGADEPGQDS